MKEQIRVSPGEKGRSRMPFSEVCVHMGLNGQTKDWKLSEGQWPSVQLLREDGSPQGGPLLPSEAGIFQDSEGFYYYTAKEELDESPEENRRQVQDLTRQLSQALGDCVVVTDLGLE